MVLAAWMAAPIHWSVAVLAVIAAGVAACPIALRVRGVVLALGAAPIWSAAVQELHLGGLMVVAGAFWLILARGWLIPKVPWVVLAIGAVQGLRLSLLGDLAQGLVLGAVGVGAAGCLAGARPSKAAIGTTAGAGLLLGMGALLASSQMPVDAKSVSDAVRWGWCGSQRVRGL